MGLFKFNFDKEGPGIEKDTPPKKGIARWWEIFVRDFTPMLLLNVLLIGTTLPSLTCIILFIAGCQNGVLPLMPLLLLVVSGVLCGPGFAAAHRLTLQMCRDIPFFTWNEYSKAFKGNFKQGAIAGAIMAVPAGLLMINFYFMYVGATANVFTLIMLLVGLYLWISMMNTLFQQIALLELPLTSIFKNSLILCLISGWRGVLVVVLEVALAFVIFVYGAAVAPLGLLGIFAFIMMTMDLIFWPKLKQLFIDHDIKKPQRRSARSDWGAVMEESEKKKKQSAAAAADAEWARAFLAEDDEPQPEAFRPEEEVVFAEEAEKPKDAPEE